MIQSLSVESLFTPVATIVSVAVAFGVMQARQQSTGKALDRLSENMDRKFESFEGKLDDLRKDVNAMQTAQGRVEEQVRAQGKRLDSQSRQFDAQRGFRRPEKDDET